MWSTQGNHDWPDALYQLLPGFRPNWANYDGAENKSLIPYSHTLIINHGLAKSEGSVRLNSSNPWDPPQIDVNFFDVDSDLDDMVDMIKFAVGFMEGSASFAKFGTKLY